MSDKQIAAIDLIIEDLYTKNQKIRLIAKEKSCEKELEDLKEDVIRYLISKRSSLNSGV